MMASLYSLATVLTIALAAFGFGRPMVRWLKVESDGNLANSTWSLGLGFLAAAWLFSVASFTGQLSPALIGIVTIVGSFLGLAELACLYLAVRNPTVGELTAIDAESIQHFPAPPNSAFRRCIAGVLVSSTVVGLVMSLAPPISPAAMSSGLGLPKSLLVGGSDPSIWSGCASPRFGGMIYAWALALDGPVAASLVAFCFGLLLAAATGLLARPLIGRTWGWCAAACALLTPGIAYQMAAPLDDLPMATFLTLALAAWWRGAVDYLSPRWFLLAGCFAGAALSTKAAAIAMVVSAATVWTVSTARRIEQREEVAVGAIYCLLISLLIACPWWAWTVLHKGQLAPAEPGASELASLGPLLTALLPGLLITRRLRGLHLLLGVAGSYLVASWLIVPRCRSFAAMVPLLAIGATWVIMEVNRLAPVFCRMAWASLTLLVCATLVHNAVPLVDRWQVATGIETRDDYLRRHVPAFVALSVANRVVRGTSRVLSEDPGWVYFDCPVVPAETHSKADLPADRPEILDGLEASGVTHLLLRSAEGRAESGDDRGKLSPLASAAVAELARRNSRLLQLTNYRATAPNGESWRYQLLMFVR